MCGLSKNAAYRVCYDARSSSMPTSSVRKILFLDFDGVLQDRVLKSELLS